ncbi:Na/Pi cotransporter family protein [Chthonobacter albigriseus]|uniref:Na/Pi cotransporter family protein n=1 Tax=Chthonobacter albigriseus TaxID=1683161 RepID=UPI0015EF454D|nr:Na/Pi cotransporter family protein [Chthonobacter albigriseus]
MATHTVLLDLFGGVALLVWATRMVKTGVLRAFEDGLRDLIRSATQNRIRGLAAGIATAALLQSSTAAGLLVASFVERGMIPLSGALAVMLGADIGSTLVVQAMSLDLTRLVPVLLIAGVVAFLNGKQARTRQVGRIAIGLGLMILSLRMIVAASAPMRESPTLDAVLAAVGGDPLVALLISAGLTWLVHSSVAMVLLFMTLAGAGVVAPETAVVLVLGANVGSGLIPLGLTAGAGPEVRRLLAGNLAFRFLGALLAIAALPWAVPFLDQVGLAPALLVACAHTGFNLLLATVFLPLTGAAASLLSRAMPDPVEAPSPARPAHLDEALLDRPNLAIGAATREVMRLADLVEMMLRDSIRAFETDTAIAPETIAAQDDAIDRLQEAIKLYLTRVTRQPLPDMDARRCFDLIVFTTNLEHVGDIIDKSLLMLAAKKQRQHLAFSETGWREIQHLHRLVLEQLRLAVTVFVTQDRAMARDLVVRKDEIRSLERQAVESHLARLRDGTTASIESSSIHLDIIRDLKRINAHVASVAYPILEQAGVLRDTRLKSA